MQNWYAYWSWWQPSNLLHYSGKTLLTPVFLIYLFSELPSYARRWTSLQASFEEWRAWLFCVPCYETWISQWFLWIPEFLVWITWLPSILDVTQEKSRMLKNWITINYHYDDWDAYLQVKTDSLFALFWIFIFIVCKWVSTPSWVFSVLLIWEAETWCKMMNLNEHGPHNLAKWCKTTQTWPEEKESASFMCPSVNHVSKIRSSYWYPLVFFTSKHLLLLTTSRKGTVLIKKVYMCKTIFIL